jgi:hypothetical protein
MLNIPLSFAPGEAYQFDWSHEIVVLNGITITVKVAHVRLCHSRMPFVRAYPRKTQEMVFDAHDRRITELAIDKQAQTLLMPVSARRQLNDLPDELWTKISIGFYKDGADAVFKALVE